MLEVIGLQILKMDNINCKDSKDILTIYSKKLTSQFSMRIQDKSYLISLEMNV